jgi:hypothetical protein
VHPDPAARRPVGGLRALDVSERQPPAIGSVATTPGAPHLERERVPTRVRREETMTIDRGVVLVLRHTVTLALAATCLAGVARADDRGDDRQERAEHGGIVLAFKTMAPIQGALVNTPTELLHDQAAGALPWVISSARGVLHADGKLEVQVRGLVLADEAPVPATLRLTNPIPTFRAVVSCVKADGTVATSETPDVGASTDGDAHIEAVIDPPLPHPCVGPIIFVGNGAQHQQAVPWFAATGLN